MKVKLVVVGGDPKASTITLRLPAVLGRGKGATVTVPHPLVSRKHCELFDEDGALMVRDLESLNGTFVGNQRVTESALVPTGELLTLACVNFRVEYGSLSGDSTPPKFAQLGTGHDETPTTHPSAGETEEFEENFSKTEETEELSLAAPEEPQGLGDHETEWQTGGSPSTQRRDNGDLGSLMDDTH